MYTSKIRSIIVSKLTHPSNHKKILITLGFAALTIGQFSIADIVHASVGVFPCPAGIDGAGNPSCVPPDVFYGSMPNAPAAPVYNRKSSWTIWDIFKKRSTKPRQNVQIPHVSVVMWVNNNGDAQYSAAVAQQSRTLSMSMDGCREQNGGSVANCQKVFDAQASDLAVIKASDGGFYFATGANKSEAQRKGLEACAKRANVTCKVDKVYGS
jgi:hypothetical protein